MNAIRQATLIMMLTLVGNAHAERVAIPATLWEQPRSGSIILAQNEIRTCVTRLLASPGSRLLVHFGRGEESLLQAEELRAWLVSLAVDGNRIELISDGEVVAGVSLEVIGTVADDQKQAESN